MRSINHLFCICWVFGLLGGFASILSDPHDTSGGQSGIYILVWVIMYSIFIASAVLIFPKQALRYRKYELILIAIGVLAIVSTAWSQLPTETFKYAASLMLTLLFSLFFYRCYTPQQAIDLITLVIGIMALVGIMLYFAGVSFAYYIDPISRFNILGLTPLKGLFSHKIYAGIYCALGFYLSFYSTYKKTYKVLISSSCLLHVMLSGSSTGLVVLIFTGLIYLYFNLQRRMKLSRGIGTAIKTSVTILGIIAFTFFNEIVIYFGRDPSLTGRTALWEWALYFIQQKPTLGWGYSGIFSDAADAPSRIINDYTAYQAPHFHNAYLQIMAELGLLGGILVFTVMLLTLTKIAKTSSAKFTVRYQECYLLIIWHAMLCGFVVNNLFRFNDISTFLISITFLYTFKYSKR